MCVRCVAFVNFIAVTKTVESERTSCRPFWGGLVHSLCSVAECLIMSLRPVSGVATS